VARSGPADFAFTHDPLSGSVTRHERGAAAKPSERGAGRAALPVDGGVYGAPEPDLPPLPATAPTSWSDLEGGAVHVARDTAGALAQSIPIPAAVH
jgi:hypothetical protein